MDIAEFTLLEKNRDDYAPLLEHCVATKIPSVKQRFNYKLEQQVILHQLYQKMNDLFNSAKQSGTFTAAEEKIYDQIEERMKRGVKFADSNCRKVC